VAIGPEKIYLIRHRIDKLCRGGEDPRALVARMSVDPAFAARILGSTFTTGHTFFFREAEHFRHLCRDLSARGIAEPRIWCAASSTGEEAYTIAISLLEAGYRRFILLASDVNAEALRACRRGRYKADRFHDMPPDLLQRYFDKVEGDTYEAKPFLRSKIILKRLNLMDNLRFEAAFHSIFLRNVFIYFKAETQGQVLGTMRANLEPGGLLYVGLSEPLLGFQSIVEQVAPGAYRFKQ
jgi:chemotaxis protein methyltransferase CheR